MNKQICSLCNKEMKICYLNCDTSVAGSLLSAAIGGAVIGGLISSALQTLSDNTPEATYGSVIQINYFPIPHVQAVWAQ